MSQYARIDRTFAKRWGELTQREAHVFVILQLYRNEKTGQCNPGRSTIANEVGFGANHVSVAIKTLRDKGFLSGDFVVGFTFDQVRNPDLSDNGKEVRNPDLSGEALQVRNPDQVQNPDQSRIRTPTGPESGLKQVRNPDSVYIGLNNEGTTKEQRNVRLSADRVKSADIQTVFAYWKSSTGRNGNTRLTKERRDKIRDRLKQFSVQELFQAVDGCVASPIHNGANDTGGIYTDIELICRNETKTAKFIEIATAPKPIGKNRDTFAKHDAAADAGSGVTPGPPEAPRRPAEGSAKALELWERIRKAIRSQVDADTFAAWFDLILMDGFAGHDFKLRAPSVAVDWIEGNYSELLRSAIVGVIETDDFGILWTRESEA